MFTKQNQRKTGFSLGIWLMAGAITPSLGLADVVINEVLIENASVTTQVMNDQNEPADYIELYNNGPAAVNLNGWFLSDEAEVVDEVTQARACDQIKRWAIPNITLNSGEYRLIYATGRSQVNPAQPLQAYFKLSEEESLYLCRPDATVVERVEFPNAGNNVSYNRFPNGTGPFAQNVYPTPGFSNEKVPALNESGNVTGERPLRTTSSLAFTEYADNNTRGISISGTDYFEDWGEICHTGLLPFPVSIAGFQFAKSTLASLQTPFAFPNDPGDPNLQLAPGQCKVILFDAPDAGQPAPAEPPFRVSFGLGAGDTEMVTFMDAEGRVINNHHLKVTGENISIGLDPQSQELVAFKNWTPGQSNIHENRSGGQIMINEMLASAVRINRADEFDRQKEWIELKNIGTDMINLKGYQLRDEDMAAPFVFPDFYMGQGAYQVIWFAGEGNSYVDRSIMVPSGISQSRQETITLRNAAGSVIGTVSASAQVSSGYSLARDPDGNTGAGFADTFPPSPAHENGLVPSVQLVISEVVMNHLPNPGPLDPDNTQCVDGDGLRDHNGRCEDWMEIHNPGTSAVNLSGFTLTDKGPDFGRWTFPQGVSIPAQGHLIVFLSGEEHLQAPLAADFTVDSDEVLVLYDNAGAELDRLDIKNAPDNFSQGQDGSFYPVPTPGAPNPEIPPIPENPPKINEVFSKGQFPDYIELHGPAGFNLEGWCLSDNPNNPCKFTFPDLSFIAPFADGADFGFILVIADEAAHLLQHADFKLGDGELVVLTDPFGRRIDEFQIDAAALPDLAKGRFPDGSGVFVPLLTPSPLEPNTAAEPSAVFLRADSNMDGILDISDAVKTLLYLFRGDDVRCEDALDSNDSGVLDLSDPVYTLNHLFRNGPRPPEPYTAPGVDLTDTDPLGCEDPL